MASALQVASTASQFAALKSKSSERSFTSLIKRTDFVCRQKALTLKPKAVKPALFSSDATLAYKTSRSTSIVVRAEADSASPEPESAEISEADKKLKLAAYFGTWWSLNVIFNIYNKKVLNAFPFPWLTSTVSLLAGTTIMLGLWGTGLVEAPSADQEFWKALAPVALVHTIGHVAATVSMSKVAVSFTHIIKSSEPAFSCIIQTLMGEQFGLGVYLSLIPIIGGCGLAALTELNFNMGGFAGAMISNLAFVFRNIFSKKGMVSSNVKGLNYYGCLSILSLLLVAPFAFWQEGPAVWAAGWEKAVADVGKQFVWWVVAQSVFYHLYNQVSYMALDGISPLTYSIGNTMKRVTVIVASIIVFRTPVRIINGVGAAVAILGTFLYSQAQEAQKAKKKAA